MIRYKTTPLCVSLQSKQIMQACGESSFSNLIRAVQDGYDRPEFQKGYFRTPYYAICLKDDIVMEPLSSCIQKTGITMKVPKHCIAVVQTAYKSNACLVEEKYYGPSHGEFELKLTCQNPTIERVYVYGSFDVAHLFLYQLKETEND